MMLLLAASRGEHSSRRRRVRRRILLLRLLWRRRQRASHGRSRLLLLLLLWEVKSRVRGLRRGYRRRRRHSRRRRAWRRGTGRGDPTVHHLWRHPALGARVGRVSHVSLVERGVERVLLLLQHLLVLPRGGVLSHAHRRHSGDGMLLVERVLLWVLLLHQSHGTR